MALLLGISVAVLVYIYSGYLAMLRLLVWLRGPRLVHRADITPPLTLVISAYNEAAVIRKKLENALSLSYPASNLEIAVISDASDDGTDQIVAEYADRGVKLIRQPERRGKTAGLNAALPQLRGELVVFSDANAMYREDALLKLARNFADPSVGCVTGEAQYIAIGGTADEGERVYWNYEMYLKRMETALGSMVGGDGAIYAIRKSLWRPLPENAINDFLNPLQIVGAGWRGVYEPEAVCYEETAGSTAIEYRRRIRIVSRSWRAIFLAPEVLNPLRVGLFAWSVVSHKMLRWLSGVFVLLGIAGLTAVSAQAGRRWPIAVPVTVAALALGLLSPVGRRAAALAGYFAVIVSASLVGVLKGTIGQVSGVWSTPRALASPGPPAAPSVPVGSIFLALTLSTLGLGLIGLWRADGNLEARFLFWGALVVLGYVYVGYPAVLALLNLTRVRLPRTGNGEPTVCLFIAAHNEGPVIEQKLLNALTLDYPAERLAIVVASDGSTDETTQIVSRFAPRVRLLDFPLRRGKTAVINDGIRSVSSDIVVFSDANTFLDRGAIRALVRNFDDEGVGAVSGDVALVGERAALGLSEDMYYRYERWVQRAESAIGSTIGVDGALYAIRRRLFVPPASDTILDDMAIPMAIVRAGHRVVIDGAARALEQGSNSAREEFSRKSRVVAGAMQFLTRRDSSVPVDAFQVAFSLISHKALRWLSPAFGSCAFVASLILARDSSFYAAAAGAQALLLVCGLAGCVPALRRISVVSLAHYFCLIQAAAGIGFLRGISGTQSVKWRRFQRPPAEAARA